MPTVICRKCGHLTGWHNRRGTRLRDFRCSLCGGQLRRAVWGKEYGPKEHKQILKGENP